eukprot:TRINITY_DN6115_c0_g1_i2.p3 TRINITY_DN6115_c0_g1~~TRINITY_DN6115_c0_g1_i2.p3  ORF type:complete len:159 (-),score=4.87 TRINITY_DN6115_c0_g1_i2:79-555(-)
MLNILKNVGNQINQNKFSGISNLLLRTSNFALGGEKFLDSEAICNNSQQWNVQSVDILIFIQQNFFQQQQQYSSNTKFNHKKIKSIQLNLVKIFFQRLIGFIKFVIYNNKNYKNKQNKVNHHQSIQVAQKLVKLENQQISNFAYIWRVDSNKFSKHDF